MKFFGALAFIAILLVVVVPSEAANVCVIKVNTCTDTVPVCGRFGGSNLCQKFRNRCELEIANCNNNNTPYRIVGANMCNGIAVNTRRLCNGLQSGGTYGGNYGGKWPWLGGNTGTNTGTNSNVQPIVIHTGK